MGNVSHRIGADRMGCRFHGLSHAGLLSPVFGGGVWYLFAGSAAGSEVVSYVIIHGDHTWPGKRAENPNDPKGRCTAAVDATKEILDFFEHHPKEHPEGNGASSGRKRRVGKTVRAD